MITIVPWYVALAPVSPWWRNDALCALCFSRKSADATESHTIEKRKSISISVRMASLTTHSSIVHRSVQLCQSAWPDVTSHHHKCHVSNTRLLVFRPANQTLCNPQNVCANYFYLFLYSTHLRLQKGKCVSCLFVCAGRGKEMGRRCHTVRHFNVKMSTSTQSFCIFFSWFDLKCFLRKAHLVLSHSQVVSIKLHLPPAENAIARMKHEEKKWKIPPYKSVSVLEPFRHSIVFSIFLYWPDNIRYVVRCRLPNEFLPQQQQLTSNGIAIMNFVSSTFAWIWFVVRVVQSYNVTLCMRCAVAHHKMWNVVDAQTTCVPFQIDNRRSDPFRRRWRDAVNDGASTILKCYMWFFILSLFVVVCVSFHLTEAIWWHFFLWILAFPLELFAF